MHEERLAMLTGCQLERTTNELRGLAVTFTRQSGEGASLLLEACGNTSEKIHQPKELFSFPVEFRENMKSENITVIKYQDQTQLKEEKVSFVCGSRQTESSTMEETWHGSRKQTMTLCFICTQEVERVNKVDQGYRASEFTQETHFLQPGCPSLRFHNLPK